MGWPSARESGSRFAAATPPLVRACRRAPDVTAVPSAPVRKRCRLAGEPGARIEILTRLAATKHVLSTTVRPRAVLRRRTRFWPPLALAAPSSQLGAGGSRPTRVRGRPMAFTAALREQSTPRCRRPARRRWKHATAQAIVGSTTTQTSRDAAPKPHGALQRREITMPARPRQHTHTRVSVAPSTCRRHDASACGAAEPVRGGAVGHV